MLRIPYKKPDQLSFESALKKAISAVFEEDPAPYEQDIQSLDSLRLSIQSPQDHEASINHHLAYYAQLNYLQSKFIFSETDVNVIFTWSNAFDQYDSVSSHNIGFEKASLIFNLGAIYNHLGQETGYENDEAMKKGALYYQKSAGCYQSILDNLNNWEIFGSPNSQLGVLANLMLGQAQEVFMKKAVAGNMKSITLAKLAVQVSNFHQCAYETAVTTDTFNQSWLSHMQAKHLYYSGVASYCTILLIR
jgi:programmed cell death 6-interacting protein